MRTDDALVMVIARNSFYRHLHFLVLGTLCLAIIVIAILLGILSYILHNPTQPLYFATDAVGRLTKVTPVTKPNMSQADVTNWTVDAVQKSFSYDFINYRAQLQNAQKFFTDFGWRNYLQALTLSNNLVALRNRSMIFIAQVIGEPKLTTEGILGGSYAWRYDMQVLMTYMVPPYDYKSSYTNPLTMSVVVQRQPTLGSYRGLAIVQVIANIAVGQMPQQQLIGTIPGAT